jgi:hypothetical protein
VFSAAWCALCDWDMLDVNLTVMKEECAMDFKASPVDKELFQLAANSTVIERNAVIESAEIYKDPSSTTVEVSLGYGGGISQLIGRYVASEHLVRRLMSAAGAEKWSSVAGRYVRVRTSPLGVVVAIGYILLDEWIVLSNVDRGDAHD